MNELLFFPSVDVLVRVNYGIDTNSIRYTTHRSLLSKERKVVENYLLKEVAPKTEYYKRTPSILLYVGVEKKLIKDLKFFRVKDVMQKALNHKFVIDNQVKDLISHSLSNYYFEKVGEEIIKLRNLLKNDYSELNLEKMLVQISVLLRAYNENSGQNINIKKVLPREVLSHYYQLTND